jgi:homoserine kinase type II
MDNSADMRARLHRSHADLCDILMQFGLGPAATFRKTHEGRVNDSWIVKTPESEVVLRWVARERSLADIQFEHSFINGLCRSGLAYRFPTPIMTKSGNSLVRRGDAYFWVYEYIEGRTSLERTRERIEQIATAMESIHRSSTRLQVLGSKIPPPTIVDTWLIEMLQNWKSKTRKFADERLRYFASHVDECISSLTDICCPRYQTRPRFPIHGDWCMSNIVFSGEELTGIIDFDNCRFDTAIRDITLFLQYECVDDDQSFKLDLPATQHFIEYYNKSGSLSADDTDMIPALAISECADALWWKMYEIVHGRDAAVTLSTIDNLFRSLCWYRDNEREIASALRP